MFTHEGPGQTNREKGFLAGYLALTAGFVNSGGFVLIGSFTSHVTGSIGRLGNDLATGHYGAALFAGLLVLAFFTGAFLASLIVEAQLFPKLPQAYAAALFGEGALLAAFIFVAGLSRATHLRALDAEAAMLCCAMGMQNSLMTRLSGAVIRTTHLTGVVTDLGIEAARWLRWSRTHNRVATPHPPIARAALLMTIAGCFSTGAVLGAFLTLRASRWAMLLPAVAVFAAGAHALLIAGRPPGTVKLHWPLFTSGGGRPKTESGPPGTPAPR